MNISINAHLMATSISIHLDVESEETESAYQALEAARHWLEDVAQRFTRFTSTSELSQLNARAGQWTITSPDLFTVIQEACAAAKDTDGLFDPTLLPLLEALGYDRDFAKIAYKESSIEWRVSHDSWRPESWRAIQCDPDGRRVLLPKGMRLDLGGLVKGWAADVVLEHILHDFAHVLVNIGGDMRARGGPEPGPAWAIGIGDARPDHNADPEQQVAVITLGEGGLATSGATQRWWYRAGERQHHIIDPRTRRPARIWIDADDTPREGFPLIVTATALAPTSAQAEVAAKVAILRGYPAALEAVEASWKVCATEGLGASYGDVNVALLLVLSDGQVVPSTNLVDYLQERGGNGALWITSKWES
jgi:FAD:protein FMN transferase